MTTSPRLSWHDDGYRIRSGRSRFTVTGTFRGNVYYRLLTDALTGREHVCRSLDSAKALARDLARQKE